ncbi:NPCBM/NEW2 domain-containing protein [uncultured Arcticibacterium sp.]|uniref:NPCBM/NEW2 domain-containing protein n=1 Tax=uncultured Arcticibacterium sp. TaxID=2173042 RepID=UPI0030F82E57
MRSTVLKVILVFLVTQLSAFSQISLDLPINKSVFQRNNSNQAKLYIAGTYQNPVVTSIQARLVTPGTSTPISGFDWQIIKSNPSKGQFQGQLNNVPAGWYTLQVRLVNTSTVLSSSNVDRVGVGDVYLISGQSNAAGQLTSEVLPLTDFSEKSLAHNQYQGCGATFPNFADLSPITQTHKISGTGESSWAYSRLGRLIAENLNIPVAFFNGAASGTSIENWVASSNGNATTHPFLPGQQYCNGQPNAIGSPYNIFDKPLKYYPAIYGVRALIWQQGESDNFLNTSNANYSSRLTTFINKTRTEIGSTLPWMVCRSSFIDNTVDVNIINAQNSVINTVSQVFAGPTTDSYVAAGDRIDNVHFDTQGVSKFADGLYNSITVGNFLTSSTPIPSKVVPELSISILNGSVTLSAPGGYSSYKWVPGNNINANALGTSASFSSSSGTYRCYLTDANGNITMSQAVNVNNILSQQSLSSTFVDSLYLSSYTPFSIQNGLGPVAFDQSAGATLNEGDGSTMEINGISFSKGIGTHSGSELVYKMKTGFHSRFKASIGIDDDSFSNANVIFKVYGENTLLYTSPSLTHLSNALQIDVNIAGYSSIKLVVENNGGNISANQADWANARIIFDKPKNFTVSKFFPLCVELNWSADTDMNGIANYQIFKDDNLLTTVPAGTLNYTFTGLNESTSYKLSVKAIDIYGYQSPKVDTSIVTPQIFINYPSSQVCIGSLILPDYSPKGGTFSINNKPDSVTFSLDQNTGEILFGSDGFVQIKYIWGAGTSCEGFRTFYLGGLLKPNAPTIANIADSLINKGSSLTFNASACSGSYTLEWQNQSTNSSITVSPNDTTSYYAFCKNSTCYSDTSNIVKVKVIPDCPNSFSLVSTKDNLNYGSKSFYFNAAQTISATNKLINPTGASFKAGKNIKLNPGFEIKAGSVFSATIGGCP